MSGLNRLELARLRWRARRGLLENDLIITRYLDTYQNQLTDIHLTALMGLLELGDHDLLDLLLGRKEPQGAFDTPVIRDIIGRMRQL